MNNLDMDSIIFPLLISFCFLSFTQITQSCMTKPLQSYSPTTPRPSLLQKIKESAKTEEVLLHSKDKGHGDNSHQTHGNIFSQHFSSDFKAGGFDHNNNNHNKNNHHKGLVGQDLFNNHIGQFFTSKSPPSSGPHPPTGPFGLSAPVTTHSSGPPSFGNNHEGNFFHNPYNSGPSVPSDGRHPGGSGPSAGYSGPHHSFSIPVPTHAISHTEHGGAHFLPKPEALEQGNPSDVVDDKNVNGDLNFNKNQQLDFNNQDFGNNLDFTPDSGNDPNFNNNGNYPFNDKEEGPPADVKPQFENQDVQNANGFYNVNEPSGSWKNVEYNAGPTGFVANSQQATQHGHATSFGDIQTFGTSQNFGF